MIDSIDITYSGKLKILTDILTVNTIEVLFTIEGKTGKPTTTSLVLDDGTMITFNFQQLKKIVESYR